MKDKIVFTFGRFNPPTTGHEKLIEKVAAVAKKENADFMVFPSHSQNPKKDPLDIKTKIGFMKKMFPNYAKNIIQNNKAKTAINVATLLYEMGYKECAMVVGGDRVTEFKTLLNKYNGVEGKHGLYDFKGGIEIHSAGERDPDAEGVTGMSASKMRAAAAANDYESFKKGLPPKFEKTTGKKIFDALKDA
ncbi:cytidyltransferase, partial [archaeon]|nr:cytidyltransferase [archaeon]